MADDTIRLGDLLGTAEAALAGIEAIHSMGCLDALPARPEDRHLHSTGCYLLDMIETHLRDGIERAKR